MRLQLIVGATLAALLGVGLADASSHASRSDAARIEPGGTQSLPATARRRAAYPLEVSKNHRYLVDQKDVPFLIVGDSPQAMIANLSVPEAASYIRNRQAAGFNSLIVDVLCAEYTGCRADGTTFDGIRPFTSPGDLSTPNPAYFRHVDAMIRLASGAGMAVFLNPIETGGWLDDLRANGVSKSFAYGKFLGKRYKKFPNIIWFHGNDFQTWRSPRDDAVALAVARGIRSVDSSRIQTVLLDYTRSGSLDDFRWRSVIKLDAAYTYHPTYAQVLKEFNRRYFMPVFMAEAGYEFEQLGRAVSYGDAHIVRRQAYWSLLSGAAGQFYGNKYTWPFRDGWKDHLDTRGSAQIGHLVKLFAGRAWFRLVPDQAHRIVTGGYGTFTETGSVRSSDYVTTAATPDGRLAMSYLPAGGTIEVDTARLAKPVRAQWFDPASGTYAPVEGSPFRGSTRIALTPPDDNADGDRDWVLVLEPARA